MWSRIKKSIKRLFAKKYEKISFQQIFEQFQLLLQYHQDAMELIADLGEKSGGDYIFDRKYLIDSTSRLQDLLLRMVKGLNQISSDRYYELYSTLDRIFFPIEMELRGRLALSNAPYVVSITEMPLDTPELTGGKANALGEIIHKLGIPAPSGFVITNRAYSRFVDYNELEERIHSWIELWINGKETLEKSSGQIRYSILAGIVPQDITRQIRDNAKGENVFWAVRSSAYGEDGDLSFAGLHESILNTSASQIPDAYKQVLASLYSPEALTYRRQMGMIGEEAAMAVLCQEMVDSRASGVIQTLSLESSAPNCLEIYAAFGLGRTVVEGRDASDSYVVERAYPHKIVSKRIVKKESLVRAASWGGEEEVVLPEDQQEKSSISDTTVNSLAKWAMALERYFKRPQEIEWALDAEDQVWILQSRRLAINLEVAEKVTKRGERFSSYPILIENQGVVAHTGVGSGPVFLVNSQNDMLAFPEGAALVTKYTAPWLAQIVPKATAIIAEKGSVAGHLATIAREFRVPALLGIDNVTEILSDGMEITLDTYHRTVYAGKVAELINFERVQSMVFEESPEFRLLRRILKRIAALHMIDPYASNFTPSNCVSVHDMIRFIHEKSVQELMEIPAALSRFKGAKVWKLESSVPLDLRILDLGGGIEPELSGDKVHIEQVRSLPLRALWEGVSYPDSWSTRPVDIDFKGLMSSLTRNWDAAGGGVMSAGFNLAVVSDLYMNLHLRLGYHFNLIDATMYEQAQRNHIYFRFVGGVTDLTRRSRRAQVLSQILSNYHFNVLIKGDLVIARLVDVPKEEIQGRLTVIGALIGFTRQLDIQLRSDQDIDQFVEQFFHQYENLGKSLLAGGENGQVENHGFR
ncbi:MAG: PEP-utilizing enzyme [Deltaproteobacteria bacterium]|nr:PEP-utilizing enzyme [Deltaproteobacteria bacterium]